MPLQGGNSEILQSHVHARNGFSVQGFAAVVHLPLPNLARVLARRGYLGRHRAPANSFFCTSSLVLTIVLGMLFGSCDDFIDLPCISYVVRIVERRNDFDRGADMKVLLSCRKTNKVDRSSHHTRWRSKTQANTDICPNGTRAWAMVFERRTTNRARQEGRPAARKNARNVLRTLDRSRKFYPRQKSDTLDSRTPTPRTRCKVRTGDLILVDTLLLPAPRMHKACTLRTSGSTEEGKYAGIDRPTET